MTATQIAWLIVSFCLGFFLNYFLGFKWTRKVQTQDQMKKEDK